MAGHTVRISEEAKSLLLDLAGFYGESQVKTLELCLKESYKRIIIEETNKAYARINADEKASRELREEQELWDNTLLDGLD